jgi:hypothetical protein
MNAREQKLDTLLRTSRLHSYAIPRYQREYRWKAERWEYLHTDIQDNESGYFIGALIFIRATSSDHGVQQYDVVDGQQRLATLSIALAALYRSIRERIDLHDARRSECRTSIARIKEALAKLDPRIARLEARVPRTLKQEATLSKKRLKRRAFEDKHHRLDLQAAQDNKAYQELLAVKQPLEDMLLINDATNNVVDVPRLALSSQKDDNANYLAVLRHCGVFDRDLPATELSKSLGGPKLSRIGKCFQYFYRKTARVKDLSSADVVQYYRKIADLTVVDIKANTTADAYVLFESLNNRGEPLTGLDLIKNQILARIEEGGKQTPPLFPTSLESATSKWQQFMAALPDPGAQDKYLRHLYLAFKKHLPQFAVEAVDKVTAQTVVGTVYPMLIKKNADKLLDHFVTHAQLYAQIVTPERIGETSIRRAFVNIQHVEAVPARILLLYLLATCSDRREEVLLPAADLILRFFIRRHLADSPKTRDLDGIFVEVTEKLASLGESASTATIKDTIRTHLERFLCSVQRVIGPLRDDVADKAGFARALLTRIEVASRSPDNIPDLWAVEGDGRPTFTLEHILPQGELKEPNWWRAHLNPHEPESADAIQAAYCHKLGNLTLTGFNQELSNKPFTEKRDYTKLGQLAGYKNGLALNEYPAMQTNWGPAQVEERTELLIRKLVPTLLFPGELEPDYMALVAETDEPSDVGGDTSVDIDDDDDNEEGDDDSI